MRRETTVEGRVTMSLLNWTLILLLILLNQGCFSPTEKSESNGDKKKMTSADLKTQNCPYGYIPVPGNSDLGTNSFCVMKYEARNISGVPTSQPQGRAWARVSAIEAKHLCKNLGPGYDLISNPEWMTIARDVESIGENWSGQEPGVGEIARGWTAHSFYNDSWTNTSFAPHSKPSCLYNTGPSICGSEGEHRHRRTLFLSTGDQIWDFSGNLYHWVDWKISDELSPAPTSCPRRWRHLSEVRCRDIDEVHDLLPGNPSYSSEQGLGQFFGGNGGAALRGGSWRSCSVGGIYTMFLNFSPSTALGTTGFRCVWREVY